MMGIGRIGISMQQQKEKTRGSKRVRSEYNIDCDEACPISTHRVALIRPLLYPKAPQYNVYTTQKHTHKGK